MEPVAPLGFQDVAFKYSDKMIVRISMDKGDCTKQG